MLRIGLVAAAIVAMSAVLGACSSTSAPTWMPAWMTGTPPTVALQFESTPAGADVRMAQGQTCKTPCALALPLTSQTATFALNGYVSQTVPVEVHDGGAFAPNPVEVTLQAVSKPAKPKPRPKTAAMTAAKPSAQPAPAQDSAFPPPPSQSPFPPPPQVR
jgi:hypothetical protein